MAMQLDGGLQEFKDLMTVLVLRPSPPHGAELFGQADGLGPAGELGLDGAVRPRVLPARP